MLSKHYAELNEANALIQRRSVLVALAFWAALTVVYVRSRVRFYAVNFGSICIALFLKLQDLEAAPLRVKNLHQGVELSLPNDSVMQKSFMLPVSLHTITAMFPGVLRGLVLGHTRWSHSVSHAFATRELVMLAGGKIRIRLQGADSLPHPCVTIIEHLRKQHGKNFLEILASFGMTHNAQDQVFVFGSKKMFAHHIVDPVYHGFAMPKVGYHQRAQRDLQHQCLRYLAQRKTVCFYPLGWENATGYKPGAFMIAMAAGVPLVLQHFTRKDLLELTLLVVQPNYALQTAENSFDDDSDAAKLRSFVWAPRCKPSECYRQYRKRHADKALRLARLAFRWVHNRTSDIHEPL